MNSHKKNWRKQQAAYRFTAPTHLRKIKPFSWSLNGDIVAAGDQLQSLSSKTTFLFVSHTQYNAHDKG